jgi:predicted nicotinamide N-methyase
MVPGSLERLPLSWYETVIKNVIVGDVSYQLTQLKNLDQTIDRLFETLKDHPESFERQPPYFGILWPAGLQLAEQIAEVDLRGKRVFEIGCGLGLASIVAAKRGAEVLAVDPHPAVGGFLAENAELNGVSVEYREQLVEQHTFDLVMGSDILYERSLVKPLAQLFYQTMAPGGRGLLADPGRPYLQNFVTAMEQYGCSCSIETSRDIFIIHILKHPL